MIKKLLQEWVDQADCGYLDGVDLDLMVRSEKALNDSVIILTAEEAIYIYNLLHGSHITRNSICKQIIAEIVEVLK